jgi:hypothetical protein
MSPIEDDVRKEFEHTSTDLKAQVALIEQALAALKRMDDAEVERLCAGLSLATADRHSAAAAVAALKQGADFVRQFAPLAALVA